MPERKAVFLVPREEDPVLLYFAPLAILSLAKGLARRGWTTTVLDAKLLGETYLPRVEQEAKTADFVWASGKIGRQLVDLIAGMKAAKAARSDVPVLFGGWHATLEPASTIASPYVDAVALGQAERTLLDVADALEGGRPLAGTAGLWVKDDAGAIVRGPDRAWENDLDAFLPLPYELIDLDRYIGRDGGKGLPMVPRTKRAINYTSSRGCPGRCEFCHITAMLDRGWFAASPERILLDLALLKRDYRVDGIDFHDSNFFANKARAVRIMEGMIADGLGLAWRTSVRVDQVLRYDDETLALMRRSGLVELALGGETGSERIMGLIGKEIEPRMVKECSRRLASFGIDPVYSIMVGFPDERNWGDTRRTIGFMAELKEIVPDAPTEYFYYTPFPGTPMFRYAVERGGLVPPTTLDGWTIFSPYDPNMPWVDETLPEILKMATTFYFRFAVPDSAMRRRFADHPARPLLRLLHRVSRLRVRRGWYALPVEYRLARFVKDVVIGRWGLFRGLRDLL
jgi:radical SAM superfamily enzyme YgiQ (UPF0313 family)